MWRASTGVIHCVFDQIPNLQNCFTTPNRNLGGQGPQTDKHLPPNPSSLYRSIFKKRRPLRFIVFIVIWSMISSLICRDIPPPSNPLACSGSIIAYYGKTLPTRRRQILMENFSDFKKTRKESALFIIFNLAFRPAWTHLTTLKPSHPWISTWLR